MTDHAELARWQTRHSDAFHPGGREACEHCQEMIRIFGCMPPADLIRAYPLGPGAQAGKKKRISKTLRLMVFERDGFACKGCGARHDLTVDHIKPESKGGTLDFDNLQTLCRPCNSRKGAAYVEGDL